VSYLLPVLVAFLFVIAAGLARYVVRLRAQRSKLCRRIKEMDHAQRVLQTQAYSDQLTGLANRNLLTDRYGQATQRAKRNRVQFAILMIDLNKFKAINDRFGHAAGDQVLIEVSRRLQVHVRATDTVSRYGGDEFVLLIESFGERRELTRIAMKLVDALSEPVTLDTGVEVSVGASVGYGLFPDDGVHLENLLEVADHAMYEFKASGEMPLFD
jgi:diguanylate cyclase (GGDEF)-like protein